MIVALSVHLGNQVVHFLDRQVQGGKVRRCLGASNERVVVGHMKIQFEEALLIPEQIKFNHE